MKKTTTYRQSKQESLFEKEFTLKALSAMGNPLEQVSALFDFEFFHPTLEKTLLTEDCKTSAGRRPIDVVLGWFYKLALLDFELIFEVKMQEREGV